MSTNWKNLLCALDFSDCSRRALELAAALAAEHQAELTLVHVCPLMQAVFPGGLLQPQPAPLATMEADAQQMLDLWRGRAEELGAVSVRTIVRVGAVWRSIVNLAEEDHSDLIVIGTHGRTGVRHLLLGSVAEQVVRHAHCPVLTVGRPAAAQAA